MRVQQQVLVSRPLLGPSVKLSATSVRLRLSVRTILYVAGEPTELDFQPWLQQQQRFSVSLCGRLISAASVSIEEHRSSVTAQHAAMLLQKQSPHHAQTPESGDGGVRVIRT